MYVDIKYNAMHQWYPLLGIGGNFTQVVHFYFLLFVCFSIFNMPVKVSLPLCELFILK